MKLKQWLKEYHNLSYAEYKALPDSDRWAMEYDFQQFNRTQQIRSHQEWRHMTDEEIAKNNIVMERERIRYETSLKIGGIDDRGNYTALSHRWENGRQENNNSIVPSNHQLITLYLQIPF